MKQIDPSEINIINYLTGEMTTEELIQFELLLDENQILREQVEDMKLVRSQLGTWENENIQIPTFDLSTSTSTEAFKPNKNNFGKSIKLPNWMKYAAAFVGFVLLFQILGFKVNHDGNTLLLSFGEPTSQNIDANSVDEIISNAIEKYAKAQNNQFVDFKNQMNSDLASINKSVDNILIENKSTISQLTGVFNQNMDKQYLSLEYMIKGIEDNQRQELEDSFTGIVEYLDNKRVNDQYKIQNAFSEIATAINNQQYQTNELLTSISDEEPGLKSY